MNEINVDVIKNGPIIATATEAWYSIRITIAGLIFDCVTGFRTEQDAWNKANEIVNLINK